MGGALERMPGSMLLLPQRISTLPLEELQRRLRTERSTVCVGDASQAALEYEMVQTRRYRGVFAAAVLSALMLWALAALAFERDGAAILLLPTTWPLALLFSAALAPAKAA
mmetsp:Transcript_56916/g.133736  ORF Transcript_56916/g.133736 Transcript_56916/m.133736 type:complete len:111 (-) Transcript_56916:31-363(-)